MAPAAQHMIDVPPLALRAEVSSFNEENRTAELIFSTGAPVERFDWMSGKRYLEVLSMEPKAIRMERMNSGAPLLDSHSAWSVTDQIGAVIPGTARVEKGKAIATVKFSAREAVVGIVRDVKDKILTSVSVGYRVRKFVEDTSKEGAIPTRTAIDWEPYEISLVSMPADTGARIRKNDVETNQCELVMRDLPQESHMADEKKETERSAFVIEQDPLKPGADDKQRLALADDKKEPNDRDKGVSAERERVQGITLACRAARLPSAYADELIASGRSLLQCQSDIFTKMRDVDEPEGRTMKTQVRGEDDPLVHVRAGIENAILHRVSPTMFKLEEVGREYRGMAMIDIARSYLNAKGVRTTSMSKSDIAGLALGLNQRSGPGYHTTSDFADLLEGIVNKTLRKAYDEAPQTYQIISRQMSAPDFKAISLIQFGEAPALEQVLEHGEYKRGTIGTGTESFTLKKYGKIFAITREAIVNDDLDAFSRVPMMFGRSARQLESDLVWAQITSNPTMGDGNALFSSAHGNLEGSDPDVIAIASLSRGRTKIRLQTGLDGSTKLNLTPKYLIVPPSQETVAQQFVGQITPATALNANPFSGLLQVIAEPRLEDDSTTAWYLAASPDQIDIVVHAYLEGQTGPVIEQRIGFDIDGLEIKARHEFAAKVVDWRGLYKDPGEVVS